MRFGAAYRLLYRLSGAVLAVPNRLQHLLPSMASGKLDTPPFKALLTPDLLRLESIFRKNGYSFRLVGGAVRDLLLERTPKDVDIATECTPDHMMRLFEAHGIRCIPTGLQHGTVTAHMSQGDYEVTTLRLDRVTDGRHAVVEFTKDWREDAERRDLTINAMSLDLQGNLYDYFNGQQHLAEKRVMFVGDARKRICEDFLRILRYFRFYGRIVPSPDLHDAATLDTIRDTVEGLTQLSVERVWGEMSKILQGNHAPHLLHTMYSLQVARNIGLPEDGDLAELERVWSAMQVRGDSLQPVSLLMTLVRSVEEAHFLIQSWKLSNNEKKLGVFVVEHRTLGYKQDLPIKTCQDFLVDGIACGSVVELLHYCDRPGMASQLQQWKVPKFPVNGRDLQTAGFKSGPALGKMLRQLQSKWKTSYFTLSKQDLIESALRDTQHR